ncbi:unnamed protein product, partial [marine sediment metagenome]
KWWQHEQAYERYDYSYTPEELSEWVPKIRKLQMWRRRPLSSPTITGVGRQLALFANCG